MSNLLVADLATVEDPHAAQRLLWYGAPLGRARVAAILLHGRGKAPEHIVEVADKLDLRDVAYVAPAAAASSWYPKSFLAPIDENEPDLTSAIRALDHLVGDLDSVGFPPERVVILGFSQGACVALEFAARQRTRFAAIVGLSGGLFGPPGITLHYDGALRQTPVFLGCSDIDRFIPLARVHESADVFRRIGACVDERIYIGMGHTINRDEIEAVRGLFRATRAAG
jgi:phospholipase/carboxylesterase